MSWYVFFVLIFCLAYSAVKTNEDIKQCEHGDEKVAMIAGILRASIIITAIAFQAITIIQNLG